MKTLFLRNLKAFDNGFTLETEGCNVFNLW